MPRHFVLLGPPASGKGTQGKRLAEREDLSYLSTGSLLRETAAGSDQKNAQKIQSVLARGEYVDDDFMCQLMQDWLERHADGWVLDGFPRTMTQCEFLRDWLRQRDQQIDAAIALDVPQDTLIERIKGRVECPECRWGGQVDQLADGHRCPQCGARAGRRKDDTVENFLKRYDEFATHTIPVIDYYEAEGILIRCDASRAIDLVTTSIEQSITPLKNHGQATENT